MAMTPQEIFDKVATHLLTQRERAFGIDGECCYRGVGGTKCAIGALIPDELYDKKLEGCSVLMDKVRQVLEGAGVLPKNSGHIYSDGNVLLLNKLQRIHDCTTEANWPHELDYVASELGLSAAVLRHFPQEAT